MAETSALLAKLLANRTHTVKLGDGKKVMYLRPPETEMGALLHGSGDTRTWQIGAEEVKRYVCGWEGFTEADILGAAVGSSDPIAFDKALWAELLADNVAWMSKIAQDMLDRIVNHLATQTKVGNDSEPA